MGDNILDKMKERGDEGENPLLDGILAIGKEVTATSDRLLARADKTDKNFDEHKRATAKAQETLRTEVTEGIKILSDRMDAMAKRQLLGGVTSSAFSLEEKVLASIPDEKRHLIGLAERTMGRDVHPMTGERIEAKGVFASPILRAASALWFQLATKAQLKDFSREHGKILEELDKMDLAFGMTPEVKAAYAEGSPSTGGYLVPTIVEAEMLRLVLDNGVVVGRARHIPMTSNTLQIPNEATGVNVYFSAEGANLTNSEGTFGQNVLNAKKIIGRATASIEVIEDSIVGLLPYLQTVFAEKIARLLDQEALEGTGTNFTGVVTESGVNSVATTTTDGDDLVYKDLVRALFAGGEASTRANGAWFMNPKMFACVVGLQESAGQPIFQYANVPNAPFGTILGYPVYDTNALSVSITRGATGSTGNIYFGDPRKLIFGDRMGLRWDVSDAPNWATYKVDMRMVGRWGFTVGVPAAWTKLVGIKQLT